VSLARLRFDLVCLAFFFIMYIIPVNLPYRACRLVVACSSTADCVPHSILKFGAMISYFGFAQSGHL
jgi:hypothetical protein